MCLSGKHFLEGVALQNLPTTFIIYPPPSEFTHHLQNSPTTFIIHPPPSEFTHHLQNWPTTFRIDPPPSDKIGFGASGHFVHFLTFVLIPKTSILAKHDLFVRKFWEISSTMSLFLILSTWWTYYQPIWIAKVKTNSKMSLFSLISLFSLCWAL